MASPEELASAIARKRGLPQAPVEGTPAPSPEQRPTVLQALGRGAAASFVPALKETGAAAGRMFVPGFSTYETMTPSPAGLPPTGLQYGMAAFNDLLAVLPTISAVRYFRQIPLKGPAPPGMKGQRIPTKPGVEKAREAESTAHERVLTALRPDQTAKEYYQAAEAVAAENAEVYYAPRVAQALEAFLTKHAPTIRQKAGLLETFPKSYAEKTATSVTTTGPKAKLTGTETVGMKSTQSIQESERYATGMEQVYQDLTGLSEKLKASGSAVEPVDWKSVKNQVQSLYNMAKGDPRRGDLIPVLRAFKEDLAAMQSPSGELMQRGDAAAQRQSALDIISDAALKNSKISTTPEGKAIRRVNANAMARELVSPDNKYIMETFSSSEREIMERTWGAISRIQELDAGAKQTISSALASVRVGDKIGLRLGEFAGQGVAPSRPYAIDMVNTAMLLPGGAQMIRSVAPKGFLTQTGQLMLINFILSTARARSQERKPPVPSPVSDFNPQRLP
jgi:hypothetical protein